MVQTVAWFSGFETGGTSEVNTIGSGHTVQTGTIITGAYSLKKPAGDANRTILCAGLNATLLASRFRFRMSALQTTANHGICRESTAASARTRLSITPSNTLVVDTANLNIGTVSNGTGTAVLAANTTYLIEFAVDLAAGGAIKVWVDGVLDINATHSLDVSGTVADSFAFGSTTPGTSTGDWYFDDARVDVGGIAQIGEGRIVTRQGTTGTPNADTWTKNGGASSATDAWSETPFSATKNCSSSSSGAAQTMPVASFGATQSGHGSETIGASDTINACKVAVIAKRATSGSPLIRRRLNGSNTDTAKAMTATDAYYDDGVWTDTVAHLNAMEAGVVKAADANLTTVEEVWVMVDYTTVVAPPGGGLGRLIRGGALTGGGSLIGGKLAA